MGYNTDMNSTTTIPAVLLPVSLTDKISVVEITNDLSSMYPIIGCDIVEPVALNAHYKACLWVDEEGICKSAPLNVRASCLLGRPIYGNAIMAGQDEQYNIVPLSLNCPTLFFQMLEEESVKFITAMLKEARAKI
jgi:Domain of unknown function (DUF3846)